MKLILVNAWLGRVLPTLLALLDAEKPDIVAGQELLSTDTANPVLTQVQVREQMVKRFKYDFFSPTMTFKVFEKDVAMGNGIFANMPISNEQTVFTNGSYVSDQTVDNYVRNPRNIQLCTLSLPDGKSLTIANHQGYHDNNPNGTEQSIIAMKKAAKALRAVIDQPLIFAGDLNVQTGSPVLDVLADLPMRNLTIENNLSTTLSPMHHVKVAVPCDHLFVTKHIQVKNFRVSDQLVSDHLALILEFDV